MSEAGINEQAVGDAMQDVFKVGAIGRKDVFVTTKLWNNNHRPERVAPAFEASRRRLQLDYLDCYLIVCLPAGRRAGAEGRARPDRLRFRRDVGGDLAGAGAPGRRGQVRGDLASLGSCSCPVGEPPEVSTAADAQVKDAA